MKYLLLIYRKTILNGGYLFLRWVKQFNLLELLQFSALLLFITAILHTTVWAEGSTDYLSGSKEQVVQNFGKDSTFMHYVYFAEVVIAAVTFVKAKNPLIFAGVIVLLILVPILLTAALGNS